jgi:cytoskeletal protein RodZ
MFGRKTKRKTIVEVPDRGFDSFDMRLGDEMRGERATAGKSLMDVQRELRIKASYIAAIENADLDAFDSPSFVAGYVRSYARYLGMDPELVFARFCEESGFGGGASLSPMEGALARRDGRKPYTPEMAARRPMPSVSTAKSIDPLLSAGNPFAKKATPVFAGFEPGALGSLAVLAALVGGLGYGGWSLVQEIQRVQVAPVEQEPQLIAELDPLAPTVIPDAPEVAGIDMPATEALSNLYRPQALEAPILTARDAPIATIAPGSVGALAPAEAAVQTASASPDAIAEGVDAALQAAFADLAEAAETPEAPPATPQVLASEPEAILLVAAGDAWVRVRAADGSTLFERTMRAGETFEIPASEGQVSVRTGNTGATYFSVAGETYGPLLPGVQVATRDVSADTIRQTMAVADLTDDSPIARVVAELVADAPLPGEVAPAE